jgi:hypothetical protein
MDSDIVEKRSSLAKSVNTYSTQQPCDRLEGGVGFVWTLAPTLKRFEIFHCGGELNQELSGVPPPRKTLNPFANRSSLASR